MESKLIIDGNTVYEIDEACEGEKQTRKEKDREKPRTSQK